MVGHNCGGLGKMPGFYFQAELDNVQDMAHRRGPVFSSSLSIFGASCSLLCCSLPGSASGMASQQGTALRPADAMGAQSGAWHCRVALLAVCAPMQRMVHGACLGGYNAAGEGLAAAAMLRLELAMYEALDASASQRRAKVVAAINKDFSPQLMVQCYNQVRSVPEQHGCGLLRAAVQCLAGPHRSLLGVLSGGALQATSEADALLGGWGVGGLLHCCAKKVEFYRWQA